MTVDQRLLLADCVRNALVGWLVTCPRSRQVALRIQAQTTTAAGFSFSRFAHAITRAVGPSYHPTCAGTGREFPLSIAEAVALANDIELDLATNDELHAAGLIAAHSPYGQPQVCSPEWRNYVGTMRAIDVPFLDGDPAWKAKVRDRLRAFRRAVTTAYANVAAE
jgi:hypothetical protein